MKWQKEFLDVILVPAGLFIMFGYHLFLLYRCLKRSELTVCGFENHSRKAWVKQIMQVDAMSRGPAFTMMNATISAANFMASTSLTLSSLIGAWVGSSSSSELISSFILGDRSITIKSIKYISILLCFLLAFASFIQCSRNYVHANLLLSMPLTEVPEDYVSDAFIRGANFWELGLRAIYFAITLLMWVFGPIPMFICSIATVVILYYLDVNQKPLQNFCLPVEKDVFKMEGKKRKAVVKGFQEHADAQNSREVGAYVATQLMSSAELSSICS